jgi:hypothetical protein
MATYDRDDIIPLPSDAALPTIWTSAVGQSRRFRDVCHRSAHLPTADMLVGLDSGQVPRFGAVQSSDELQMLRPRMRRLKGFDKHSLVHIRVSLRRRDRDASQQLLDGAQIATLSQEIGRPAATALADAYWDRSRPVRVPYAASSANSGLRERSPPWKRKSSRPANA